MNTMTTNRSDLDLDTAVEHYTGQAMLAAAAAGDLDAVVELAGEYRAAVQRLELRRTVLDRN